MTTLTAQLHHAGWRPVAGCLDWQHKASGATITHSGNRWHVTGKRGACRTLAEAATWWIRERGRRLFV